MYIALSAGASDFSAVTDAFSTAANNVQTNVTSMITTALPVGLAIMGLILAITVGVKFFKRIAK